MLHLPVSSCAATTATSCADCPTRTTTRPRLRQEGIGGIANRSIVVGSIEIASQATRKQTACVRRGIGVADSIREPECNRSRTFDGYVQTTLLRRSVRRWMGLERGIGVVLVVVTVVGSEGRELSGRREVSVPQKKEKR